jgi:hypothetical protein
MCNIHKLILVVPPVTLVEMSGKYIRSRSKIIILVATPVEL